MLYGVLLLCSGNDNLYLLTSSRYQQLRVDLADFEGNTAYAEFEYFRVSSNASKYRLESIGTYTGTAGITELFYCYYPVPDRSGDGVLFLIDFFVCLFLCIFVSLLSRLRENGWTDLREIFREGSE